jgi:hypothetical protein
MIRELKDVFDAEMDKAKQAAAAGEAAAAMAHLERAHVLGQDHVGPHALTHWWMLRIAAARGRLGDAIGQAVRIVLGAIGSAIGRVPSGNTGGSDVGMFQPMPVAPLDAKLIERDRKASRKQK